jgi:hypothetical protein
MPVKENTYALTDLERVKAHGDITGDRANTELVLLVNEVSARIESFLGRHLLSRTWTHDGTSLPRLDSHGGTRLYLPEWPVTSVTSLKTYPTNSALTEGYDEDFLVDNSTGIIRLLNQSFWDAPQVVEITYVAGYKTGLSSGQEWLWGQDEVSAELRLAATKQTVWEFRQKDREREGIASRSEAGTTVSFLQTAWLPEVEDILRRHQRIYT